MFEQVGNSGEIIPDWYHGVVVKIMNKGKQTVEIKWDEKCLHGDDKKKTKHPLLITEYNPKTPQKNAWRQYRYVCQTIEFYHCRPSVHSIGCLKPTARARSGKDTWYPENGQR